MAISHSTESVTRACWARGLPADQWHSLVSQAAQAQSLDSQQLEREVIETLLSLLLSYSTTSPSPAALSYLAQSLRAAPSHPALVRPATLLSQSLTNHQIQQHHKLLESLLHLIQQAPNPSWTPEEWWAQLPFVCDLLGSPAHTSAPISPTTLATADLFFSHAPNALKPPEPLPEELLAKVDAAIDALSSRASSSSVASAVELALERVRNALASAQGSAGGATAEGSGVVKGKRRATLGEESVDERVFKSGEVSVEVGAGVAKLLSPSSSSPLSRLSTLLHTRLDGATARGSSASLALSATLLELILATTKQLRTTSHSKETNQHVTVEAFVYGRLPELLRQLFDQGGLGPEAGADALQEALEAALRAFASTVRSELDSAKNDDENEDGMEVDAQQETSSPVLNRLLTALARQELISADTWASLADGALDEHTLGAQQPACQQDSFVQLAGDTEAMQELLVSLPGEVRAQRAIVDAIQYAIEHWSQSTDLGNLSAFCKALLDTTDALDIAFVYLSPVQLLGPVRQVLDACDTSEQNFEDTHPIERYGSLILFLQCALARFDLYETVTEHVGAEEGFCAHWLRSTSAVYALAALDEDGRGAVHGWIGGLFGEGISDELINSTNPRVLLRVAPTICQQSLVACQLGVIDHDTLSEGLLYYLQPLLSFTLPGVMRWLVGEIARTEQGKARGTMVEVVRVWARSEECPRSVLELVAADLEVLDRIARPEEKENKAQ